MVKMAAGNKWHKIDIENILRLPLFLSFSFCLLFLAKKKRKHKAEYISKENN